MRRGHVLIGILLVFLGGQLLLRELEVATDVSLWPAILIILGAWTAFERFRLGGGGWFLPLGLIAAGVIVLLRDVGTLDEDFSVWPVLLILLGASLLVDSFQRGRTQG